VRWLAALAAGIGAAWVARRAWGDEMQQADPDPVPADLRYLTTTSQPLENTPPRELWPALQTLHRLVLQLRQRYGDLRVTSGYRSPAVNAAVGGVPSSLHLQARAVDVVPTQTDPAEVYADLYSRREQLRGVLQEVILYEVNGRGTRLHIGLGSGARFFRKQTARI